MNRKVGLTFGSIVIAMAALGLVTVGSLFVVRSSVGGVTSLSNANQALQRVQTQAIAAQGQLKDYVIRPDEKLQASLTDTLDEAISSLDDADEGARAIGEAEALASVRTALQGTRDSAGKIIAAQQTISEQVNTELIVRGPAIAQTLHAIAKSAHEAGKADASYSAGVAQAQYLEMRVNVTRYLSDASPATAKLAKENLLNLEDSMNVLFEELEGSNLASSADKVIVEVVAYDKSFDRVTAATEIRNREIDRMLKVSGPMLTQNAERIVDAINRRQGGATLTAQATSLAAVSVALLASGIGIAVALLAGVLTQRIIAQPIANMAELMRRLASGDVTIEVAETGRTDEVGDMARAVEIFRAQAREVDERRAAAIQAERRELEREQILIREREAEAARAEAKRREEMLALANAFEDSVRDVVESVSSSAGQIKNAARLVRDAAEQNGQLTASVATAATQTSQNSLIVASATEQMSLSIAEVSQQIAGAATVAHDASSRARSTDAIVGNLIEDTKTIEGVVALIADVARQTNMLALNATIEASRAGDAGRGFAVVANEIKSLASKTAQATEAIGTKIARTRDTTGLAANAITDIARTVDEISGIATIVATAMEEQKLTTAQIAETTSQAAEGSHNVARNIGQVHEAVDATRTAAQESLRAADDLNHQADTLKTAVASFLATVRAA
jgi:methyl-accepting chemotaxis protein